MTAFVVTFMLFGVFALMIAASVLRGYVLSILWGWFAVPLFNLPILGIPQAVGLALIVSLATHQYVPSKEGDVWMPIVTTVLAPFCALAIGWIVRRWL